MRARIAHTVRALLLHILRAMLPRQPFPSRIAGIVSVLSSPSFPAVPGDPSTRSCIAAVVCDEDPGALPYHFLDEPPSPFVDCHASDIVGRGETSSTSPAGATTSRNKETASAAAAAAATAVSTSAGEVSVCGNEDTGDEEENPEKTASFGKGEWADDVVGAGVWSLTMF